MDDERYMREALKEALKAYDRGEHPIGAVMVREGAIIARAGNQVYANHDPSISQFLPPLVIDNSQVDWIIERLDAAMTEARRLLPLLQTKKRLAKLGRPFQKRNEGQKRWD